METEVVEPSESGHDLILIRHRRHRLDFILLLVVLGVLAIIAFAWSRYRENRTALRPSVDVTTGAFVLNSQGDIVAWNHAAERVTGYRAAEVATIEQLTAASKKHELRNKFAADVAKWPVKSPRYVIQAKDGTPCEILVWKVGEHQYWGIVARRQ